MGYYQIVYPIVSMKDIIPISHPGKAFYPKALFGISPNILANIMNHHRMDPWNSFAQKIEMHNSCIVFPVMDIF
jgi:hypothetical protein